MSAANPYADALVGTLWESEDPDQTTEAAGQAELDRLGG
jgi:hypothetical protein